MVNCVLCPAQCKSWSKLKAITWDVNEQRRKTTRGKSLCQALCNVSKQSVPLPALLQYKLVEADENSLVPTLAKLAKLSPRLSTSP